MTFIVVLVGWILSLSLHEFSHALLAYMGGDYTVRDKGYLTFNPLKYTHPVYSLLLPLLFLVMGGIGLPGGAVYIETWRLRSKNWRTAVSLAGPLSNLLLAIVLGLVLRFSPVNFSGVWPGLAFLA
jgi:Zn-dependent protease